MGKRDDLIEKYAAEIKQHFGENANMDLLKKVTIGCGPTITEMPVVYLRRIRQK